MDKKAAFHREMAQGSGKTRFNGCNPKNTNVMKHSLLLFTTLLLLASCTGFDVVTSVELTHTGCANDTKGLFGNDDDTPYLYLEKTSEGLAVTRTNAILNCIIKTSDNALVCDVEIVGSDIYYSVYEREGPLANCICPVERISSTITGLKEDTEYVLHYSCGGNFLPINFRYHKGLKLKLNLENYRE